MSAGPLPTVSLVLPLYQGGDYLERVLPPLVAAVERGELLELVVVDDGSTDGGPERCRAAGARVLGGGVRRGPGAARNQGAAEARGDVLLFVDADVVVHPDVPRRVAETFAAEPDCVALFGSYDDRPAAPGWVSRYRNLLHHHVHQTGEREATTFWAGCGAVRRAAYLAVGGFDVERFPVPSIEDIELGQRLKRAGGRILLCPELQATHLKRWTLGSMVRTDVLCRALPWSRLLLATDAELRPLNVRPAERARALLACGFFASLPLALVRPALGLVPLALLCATWAASARFHALVLRSAGPGPLLAALALHPFYYLYATATFAFARLEQLLGRNPQAQGARA